MALEGGWGIFWIEFYQLNFYQNFSNFSGKNCTFTRMPYLEFTSLTDSIFLCRPERDWINKPPTSSKRSKRLPRKSKKKRRLRQSWFNNKKNMLTWKRLPQKQNEPARIEFSEVSNELFISFSVNLNILNGRELNHIFCWVRGQGLVE